MSRTLLLALTASLVLAGCGNDAAEQQTNVAESKRPWAEFAATVIDDYYARNPETAVDAGLHQYDGQMSDLGMAAVDEYAAWLDAVLAEAATYADLEGIEAFERDYLSTALQGELFWIRESGFLTSNPLAYAGAIGISVYVDREYAPLDQRLLAYTQ